MKNFIIIFLFLILLLFFYYLCKINFFFLEKNVNLVVSYNISNIVEKVLPSMVTIISKKKILNKQYVLNQNFNFKKKSIFCKMSSPFLKSNFCNFVLNNINYNNQNKKFSSTILGSGVIIDKDYGYIVTNNHVVDNLKKIYVKLYDGRIYQAKVLIADINIDIAIIKIYNVHDLISIDIINSNRLHIGDKVIAIGNPYGLENTVTTGIISALGRKKLGIEYNENFIQIDAAINQGNSGGALLNIYGQLIGINTAVFSPNGGNIGIGFSIPISIIKIILKKLINIEFMNFNILNFNFININLFFSKINNISVKKGLMVNKVLPLSIFYFSGIKKGDIIISINNSRIIDFDSFNMRMNINNIKRYLSFKILRNNILKHFFLNMHYIKLKIKKYFNLNIIFDNKNIVEYLIKDNLFLRVEFIKKNSWIEDNHFKIKDLIISINNYNIYKIKSMNVIINFNIKPIIFYIQRNNSFLFFIIKE